MAAHSAQVLAVTLVGGGLFTLGAGHLVVTATFDFLVWVVITFLVLRLLRTAEDRWWLVIGVVAGIGLLNKALPAVLILGIAAGWCWCRRPAGTFAAHGCGSAGSWRSPSGRPT